MCQALIEQGMEVVLATTDHHLSAEELRAKSRGACNAQSGCSSLLPGSLALQGVPTFIFPKQLGNSFKYSRPFALWLNKNVANYDLVHIHAVFNHSCIAAARACRENGVPYIVRPLGTLDTWSMQQKRFRKNIFWYSGIKRMLTRAAAIHYTATAEQEGVEKSLHLNHGFVVPLGVGMNTMRVPDAGETLSHYFPELVGHPYVLVLSRLHPKKSLEILINAFLPLVNQTELSEWRLVIAGDGDAAYVSSLKRIVAKKDGQEFVLFTGWLEGEKKSAALRNAALVALPSRQENFGLCVAEAMSCGVPVLVSPQVNLADTIESFKCGWVAELDDGTLSGALAVAMRDGGERAIRGAAGRELALHRFSWSAIASDLSRVYASTINQQAKQSQLTA